MYWTVRLEARTSQGEVTTTELVTFSRPAVVSTLACIAELEGRLVKFECPAKTPDTSSLPPSKGHKPDRLCGDKPPRKGRPGFGRALEANPDRVVDATLDACPHCAAAFPAGQQTPQQVYDRIELPPVKPDVPGYGCSAAGAPAAAGARLLLPYAVWNPASPSASR